MNELKKEAIKKAYGEYYEQWENFIDTDGWCTINTQEDLPDELNHYKVDWILKDGINLWRPKSLNGIENNNGWIRIESENDIELCDCFFVTKIGNIYLGNIKRSEGEFFFMNDIGEYTYDFITHYQPINKPNPPIY